MSEPGSRPDGPTSLRELTGRVGKYEILRPLGRGSMGIVYLARDTILERPVALKVMAARLDDDPGLKLRFEREAKAVAKMTHPNVVTVFDLGYLEDGSPYIAMELLEGEDLQHLLAQHTDLPLNRKVHIIIHVLAGLAHAHKHGIVHRDVKPANVFIGSGGSVRIMDFGVARLAAAGSTGSGTVVGTAAYMSPEQIQGAAVDGRSDLFSVGCMLFELVTGHRPFESESLMTIFYKITHEDPRFDLLPWEPEYQSLEPILRKALTREADGRYQTAYEFALDLRNYLKGSATTIAAQRALEDLVEVEPAAAPAPPAEEPPPPPSPAREPVMEASTVDLGSATDPKRAEAVQRGAAHDLPAAPGPSAPGLTVVAVVAVLLLVAGYARFGREGGRPEPQPAGSVTARTLPERPPTAPPATWIVPEAPFSLPPAKEAAPASASLRAAEAAFRARDYDRAIAEAQAALLAEPGSAAARRLIDDALGGRQAEVRFRTAEEALQSGDLARALVEAESGRSLAPWDGRGGALVSRIRRLQRLGQQQESGKVADALNQADAALAAGRYDAAIALYDEVLKVDSQNPRATLGRTSAVGAKAVAQAAGGPKGPPPRGFVAGKTSATSAETQPGGEDPEGFELTPGVVTKKATQPAELPGEILFEVEPQAVRPGDPYKLRILFRNAGAAPITIREMIVTSMINGRNAGRGPVPALAVEVAPRQKALLKEFGDSWKDGVASWSMDVVVRTAQGETYRNQVAWK